MVLMLDTNVLLEGDGLGFLEKLVKDEFDDVLPHCSVLIPHIVLCELDKHKMSRKDGEVKFRARCAGRFLSDYFDGGNASGGGRIAGQTVEEHTENARRYAGGQNPDDHYLFCGLQYRDRYQVESAVRTLLPITRSRKFQINKP